tara:strand:+ start:34 stop:375 length:342 start_codon:yes stop_codon:yes gene_type:complete
MAYYGENAVFAWINFDGAGTPANRDSYNVSSVTDVSESLYTITFSTAYGSRFYCIAAFAGYNSYDQQNFVSSPPSTNENTWNASGSCRVHAVYGNNQHNRDPDVMCVTIIGDN